MNVIVGLLGRDPDVIAAARAAVAERIGPVDRISGEWPFDHTRYYEAEFGPDLRKTFCTLALPGRAEDLADIKIATHTIERDLASGGTRRVNIDPGYVSLAKVVLATTKDHGHRIYLRDGIYAEVTLTYRDGAWRTWPWTYPDYADARYHAFFDDARMRLREYLG